MSYDDFLRAQIQNAQGFQQFYGEEAQRYLQQVLGGIALEGDPARIHQAMVDALRNGNLQQEQLNIEAGLRNRRTF